MSTKYPRVSHIHNTELSERIYALNESDPNSINALTICNEAFVKNVYPKAISYVKNLLEESLDNNLFMTIDEPILNENTGTYTDSYNGEIYADYIQEAANIMMSNTFKHLNNIFTNIMEDINTTNEQKLAICEALEYPAVLVVDKQPNPQDFFTDSELPIVYVNTVQVDKYHNQSLLKNM